MKYFQIRYLYEDGSREISIDRHVSGAEAGGGGGGPHSGPHLRQPRPRLRRGLHPGEHRGRVQLRGARVSAA